jgi:hypothetical protein
MTQPGVEPVICCGLAIFYDNGGRYTPCATGSYLPYFCSSITGVRLGNELGKKATHESGSLESNQGFSAIVIWAKPGPISRCTPCATGSYFPTSVRRCRGKIGQYRVVHRSLFCSLFSPFFVFPPFSPGFFPPFRLEKSFVRTYHKDMKRYV